MNAISVDIRDIARLAVLDLLDRAEHKEIISGLDAGMLTDHTTEHLDRFLPAVWAGVSSQQLAHLYWSTPQGATAGGDDLARVVAQAAREMLSHAACDESLVSARAARHLSDYADIELPGLLPSAWLGVTPASVAALTTTTAVGGATA